MLNYTAFAVVFMVVSIAVPHMAAGIAGGTIGLALNHAFEAAYVAQTIIRPITSALQTGFNKIAQIGSGSAGNSGEPATWVKAMDFGRQTQQPGNLGSEEDSVCQHRRTFAARPSCRRALRIPRR